MPEQDYGKWAKGQSTSALQAFLSGSGASGGPLTSMPMYRSGANLTTPQSNQVVPFSGAAAAQRDTSPLQVRGGGGGGAAAMAPRVAGGGGMSEMEQFWRAEDAMRRATTKQQAGQFPGPQGGIDPFTGQPIGMGGYGKTMAQKLFGGTTDPNWADKLSWLFGNRAFFPQGAGIPDPTQAPAQPPLGMPMQDPSAQWVPSYAGSLADPIQIPEIPTFPWDEV